MFNELKELLKENIQKQLNEYQEKHTHTHTHTQTREDTEIIKVIQRGFQQTLT
jgi:glutathionylspermidine synthase